MSKVISVNGKIPLVEGKAIKAVDSGADIALGLTSATPGQIAAVDDNGVPTAWEPVDMPSGDDEWELIYSDTQENIETAKVTIGKDNAGNSFELKKVRIHLALRAQNQTFNYPYNGFNSNFYPFQYTGRPYPAAKSLYSGHFYYYDSTINFGMYLSSNENAANSTPDRAIAFASQGLGSILLAAQNLTAETIKSFWFGINVNHLTDYKIIIYGVRA